MRRWRCNHDPPPQLGRSWSQGFSTMTVYLPPTNLNPSRNNDRLGRICECGDHAFAALTKGFVTLVSPEDIGLLNQKWVARKSKNRFYATRTLWPERKPEMLHNIIVDREFGEVDHINTHSLDNRRPNLRNSSRAQNMWNVNGHRNKRSKLPKGVTQKGSRFRASIMFNGVRKFLGSFCSPEEASAAYILAARNYHEGFARADGQMLTFRSLLNTVPTTLTPETTNV